MPATLISGIDVSNHQRDIDWPTVAVAGYQFAIAKASEGVDYADPYFPANWTGMQAAGLARGAYHFAQPDDNSPEDEADWFLSHVGPVLAEGDVVALDLETGSGDLSGWALTWLDRVAAAVGFRPMLYSSTSFLGEHGCLNNPRLSEYGLWLAAWQATMPDPAPGWPVVAVWQHSSSLSVPGIAGRVDGDRFNGTLDQLRLYGKPATPEPQPAALVPETVAVVAEGSGGLNLRPSPTTGSRPITLMPEGQRVYVGAATATGDGYDWREVATDLAGRLKTGWVAVEFLTPA